MTDEGKVTVEEFKGWLGRLNYEAEQVGDAESRAYIATQVRADSSNPREEARFHQQRRDAAYERLVALFTRALEQQP